MVILEVTESGSENLSQKLLLELKRLCTLYEDVLFAVDVMGSVARLKPKPNDLDISIWVDSAAKLESKRLDDFMACLINLVHRHGLRLDVRVLYTPVIRHYLETLATAPRLFMQRLSSGALDIADASAVLHAVKLVDVKTAALLYALYLTEYSDRVPWHNVFVCGEENVKKLVSSIGVDKVVFGIKFLARLCLWLD